MPTINSLNAAIKLLRTTITFTDEGSTIVPLIIIHLDPVNKP